jgi:sugar phosphate isomerase/epimerase
MPERKFTMALTPGSIGVKVDQRRAVELAHYFGFESVEAYARDLAPLSDAELKDLRDEMRAKHVAWAMAGLPVEFRRDEERFREGMKDLPAACQTLQRAGVTRLATWLSPMHESLTYLQNFKQTASRLREIAAVAGDHGLRFGLEYVGTKSLRMRQTHQFVHTMAETKELIAEVGKPNVGFVLDSWHWWTADETAADILTLTNRDIISCDLNDAPKGIPKIEQQDGSRELPGATGEIDIKSFLEALVKIGYDGPIRAEPFNKALNDMDDEGACATVAEAMRQAFALVG